MRSKDGRKARDRVMLKVETLETRDVPSSTPEELMLSLLESESSGPTDWSASSLVTTTGAAALLVNGDGNVSVSLLAISAGDIVWPLNSLVEGSGNDSNWSPVVLPSVGSALPTLAPVQLPEFNAPGTVWAATSLPEYSFVSVADKPDLDKIIAKFNESADAKQILVDAAKNQGVDKIQIKLFNKGDFESDFAGYWASEENTIYILSDQTLEDAVSTLLFEALRGKQEKSKLSFWTEAGKGKFGRDEYARKQEEFGYEVVRQHHMIAAGAVADGKWNVGTDSYKATLDGDGKTFDGYFKSIDTPTQGQGKDDTHPGFHRKYWDKNYKAAWEKANPPQP